jgi:catechol 2,3-dioxygenase-like lactoylglutathione lyase family enzyme/predicted enzyme related to lactoylglutathione lyase
MKLTVRGVHSVDIDMSQPERAAAFYKSVWNLTEVARQDGAIYFRGTGPHHHILAIHPAPSGFAIRRLTFDAASKQIVDALHGKVSASGCQTEAPHALSGPGGGYGFGFQDPEGRSLAVICDEKQNTDSADVRDRPRKIAHVNLNAAKLKETNDFLVQVLGFRYVDHSGPLHFFHCDTGDHCSIVTGQTATPTLNHVSFELPTGEDVMRGAGRMRDAGYPIEWGVGRHGAGNNVFSYFAGPEEFPIEYTAEVMQIDDSYEFHGPDHWKWPPGRLDQWGVTPPHTQRWKRVQDLYLFAKDQWKI